MAPKIGNCPICGKLYADTGIGMCRDCYEKEQEQEQEVARYVRENPRSNVKDIVEATGVKERVVTRMIRAGRFIEAGIEVQYPCEACGKMIHHGRYCEECNKNLQEQAEKARKELAKKAAALKPEAKRGGGLYVNRLKRSN